MDYLPSTKFIKTVVTAFGVILGGWLILYAINRLGFSTKETLTPQEIVSVKAYDLVSKDSDNDGLKDWEEVIWNTDPQNSDTDGDGTQDGEEITLHRDPMIAGPNDYLIGYKPESTAINNQATSTFTNQLSNDFLTRYFLTKGLNDGAPIDEMQKNDLNSAFVRDFQNKVENFHKDEFSEKDIIVSTRKSPKEYINDLEWADSTYYKGLKTLELDIFKEAVSSKDFSKLSALDPYIAATKKHIAFLKKEEVPISYADLHLEFLNVTNNAKYADEKMRNLENDPLGAIAGAQYFATQVPRFINVLKNIKERVDSDKLIFNKNESGAQFYNYLPSK